MRALNARARRHGLSAFAALLITPALVASAPVAASDPALEVQAKAALAADPDLAGLSLMVSVVDRIAVVGGALPNADMATRVEAVVRKVTGLTDVRVTCWVPSAGADPLRKLVADRLKQDERPPLALAPRPSAEPPPQLALAPRETPFSGGTVTVQRIAAPPALAGLLQAPVAPGGELGMPSPTRSYPSIPAPAVPTTPATSGSTLTALRRDQRFGGLTVELQSGFAVIGGRAASHADTWAFADALSKLPGIGRVVMGDVDVP